MSRFRVTKAAKAKLGEQPVPCFAIVDTTTGRVVDTARNEARARLLVVRYNREAANDPKL